METQDLPVNNDGNQGGDALFVNEYTLGVAPEPVAEAPKLHPDGFSTAPVITTEQGMGAIANPTEALGKIAVQGQVDTGRVMNQAELEFARADRLKKFEETASARLQQRETFKADVERSVPQIQKEAMELEESYKKVQKDLGEARSSLSGVRSEIAREKSEVIFMELSLELSGRKLETKTGEIEDKFSKDKEIAGQERDRKLAEVNEKYKPEVAEAERLLGEYRAKLEAGQSLDESTKAALATLGLESTTFLAGKVLEGAQKGEELQNKRLANLTERRSADEAAIARDYDLAVKTAEADKTRTLVEAKTNMADETRGFEEKIEQRKARLGELEKAKASVEENVQQLETRRNEVGKQRDQRVSDSKEVLVVISDLQALIDTDKELLGRAAEKMSSVELRGAEALKGLEDMVDVISMSEFSVIVETAKSMDALSEATNQWKEEINDAASRKIDEISDRKRAAVDGVTRRVLAENDELGLDEKGNFQATNGAVGFEAVDMIMEAYEPVKEEIREIRLRARDEIKVVNSERDEELDRLNRARVAGETRMNQMMEETRSNLAVMSSLVGFLRNEATERFGAVIATENPTEVSGLTAFMKRAGKAVSGMWSRLTGRRR